MKAILCFMLAYAGVTMMAGAQATMPTAGPSFSIKDTSKAEVIAVASMQAYPTGIDRQGSIPKQAIVEETIPDKTAMIDQGPIRDWSNPPGYMGASSPSMAMSRHKPLSPKKYHRAKANRCYTF
jgi:hypothetical protein